MNFIGTILLIGATMAFEYVNYQTSVSALARLLGNGGVERSLAVGLAVAFALVDIGGLARIFTREKAGETDEFDSAMLFFAWLAAITVNGVLTWDEIDYHLAGASGIRAFYPVALAVAVVLTRITLIRVTGSVVDNTLNNIQNAINRASQKTEKALGGAKKVGAPAHGAKVVTPPKSPFTSAREPGASRWGGMTDTAVRHGGVVRSVRDVKEK